MIRRDKILVCCDDLYHSAATVRAGLNPLLGAGWKVDWLENARDWDPRRLGACRAVILSKSNVCAAADPTPWLVGSREGALRDFVQAGGGLLAVHSGTASYQEVPAVRAVLGGVFVRHPPPGPVSVEPRAGHALTAGVDGPFTVHDEHYQMVLDDPAADVFLHSCSSHGREPAGWTRVVGAGRVAVLTPGHFPEVWLHPGMQRLLGNALRWVSSP